MLNEKIKKDISFPPSSLPPNKDPLILTAPSGPLVDTERPPSLTLYDSYGEF